MRKVLQSVTLLGIVGVFLVGCSTGEVSEADIKKNAKAQADWIAAHPPPADTHVEH